MLNIARAALSIRAASLPKMAPYMNGLDARTYSTTALKRWSCLNSSEPLPGMNFICRPYIFILLTWKFSGA